MGMFDYVEIKLKCHKCDTMLAKFQSKDGDCALEHISIDRANEFYDICPKCKTWNMYVRKKWHKSSMKDFEYKGE